GNKDIDAYFFSARNKKYQNGTRADRSVKKGQGHWRMGSKTKEIPGVNGRTIVGYKKRYFVKGSDIFYLIRIWVRGNNMRLDDWVICQVHWHENDKQSESTAEVDSDGNVGSSINNTCNKKRRIEKERKVGKGQASIKIEGEENIATSSNVPGPIYGNQFNYYCNCWKSSSTPKRKVTKI
ncbi:hypothetical protein MKW92_012115, partial [Papaver armeniacum]